MKCCEFTGKFEVFFKKDKINYLVVQLKMIEKVEKHKLKKRKHGFRDKTMEIENNKNKYFENLKLIF